MQFRRRLADQPRGFRIDRAVAGDDAGGSASDGLAPDEAGGVMSGWAERLRTGEIDELGDESELFRDLED